MADILQLQALLAANGIGAPVPKVKPRFTVEEITNAQQVLRTLPDLTDEDNPNHLNLQHYNKKHLSNYNHVYVIKDNDDKLAGVVGVSNHKNGLRLLANLGTDVRLNVSNESIGIASSREGNKIPILHPQRDGYGCSGIYAFGPTAGRAAIDFSEKTSEKPLEFKLSGGMDVALGGNTQKLDLHFYDGNISSPDITVNTRITAPASLMRDALVKKNTFYLTDTGCVDLVLTAPDGRPDRNLAYTQQLGNDVVIKTGWIQRKLFSDVQDLKLELSIDGDHVVLMDTRAAQAQAEKIKEKSGQLLDSEQELELLNTQVRESEKRLEAHKKKANEITGHGLPPIAPAPKEAVKGKGGR